MKRSQAFTGNYLKQEDAPHPFVATVGSVQMETLGQGADAETKPVLHFTDSHIKPMVLNFGNWTIIESAYGEDSDMWTGKPVEVYVDPNVMFGSKKVGGLRLRIPSNSHVGPLGASVMNLPMALTALQAVGVTKEDLVRVIKSKGFTGYVPNRDTATVHAMIEEAKHNQTSQEQPFDEFNGDAEDPF